MGTESHLARLDSIPRTKKERAMHLRAIARLHHEDHRADQVWEYAVDHELHGPEKILTTLDSMRDRIENRVERRGGWVPRLEDRDTKPGRTYASTKQGIRTSGRLTSRALKPVKKAWHFLRD